MVVVIKNKEDIALERFIFAVKTMIEVELFDKDTRLPSLAICRALTDSSVLQCRRCYDIKVSRTVFPVFPGQTQHD